jgi:hypothetical protein
MYFCLFVYVQDIHKPKLFFLKQITIIHFYNLNERKVTDLENTQIMCLYFSLSKHVILNPRPQERKRLNFYYKKNGIIFFLNM